MNHSLIIYNILALLIVHPHSIQSFVVPISHTNTIHLPTTTTTETTFKIQPIHINSLSNKLQFKYSHDSSSSYTTPSLSYTTSTTLFGIPKMFRWLTDQYPNINSRLSEGLPDDKIVDNFYLDMNGIIHPCTHGNNQDEIVVLDETAMFKKIFGYVDRLYKIVRPRKLLYLAVDGVAPRAKMNQQRSRRFRSSREAEELAATILARDGTLPEGKKFDSNCITPGTDFMLKLSIAMVKWIEFKQNTDPFWMNGADVVFTGPDVPGEGEHKVMDYIRETKALYNPDDPDKSHPHWKPNLTHVLYGLDADLIMLGLVTHEPNFMLLREKMSVVMAGRGRHKHRKKKDMLEYTRDDFELLELSILRQMFQVQFRKFANQDAFRDNYSIERIIDDFVFMCMLVGNDFLPHCPHLEIDNGALSLMLNNYIDLLPEWGGYLTNKDKIHPERFEQFLYHLAVFEEEHFKRRGYEENEPGWKLSSENETEEDDFYGRWYGDTPTPKVAKRSNSKKGSNIGSAIKAEKKFHKMHPKDLSRSYRDFYYETKLGWSPAKEDRASTLSNRRAHVRDYLEGLHWVLSYYHKGCQSWNWYFPHLYSPLCTDLVNLNEFYEDFEADNDDKEGFKTFIFEQTEPFPSLAQLLSVLPPQSAGLLPKPLGELMIHPASPIAEYYPSSFTSDANGKRQPWEAVVKIPFIDGEVLLDVVNAVINSDKGQAHEILTVAEKRRNERGESRLFVPKRENGATEANFPVMENTTRRKPSSGRRQSSGSRPPSGERVQRRGRMGS
jgi:5'-3' exoribonuclease 1